MCIFSVIKRIIDNIEISFSVFRHCGVEIEETPSDLSQVFPFNMTPNLFDDWNQNGFNRTDVSLYHGSSVRFGRT